MIIRDEHPRDIQSIFEVNRRAFGGLDEARLVDALRAASAVTLSLVAEDAEGRVIGHILFSPVRAETPDGDTIVGVGLAPMAVAPESQRHGVGSALVRAGLDRLTSGGQRFVVVLGHSEYYPRFGFVPASHHGMRWERPAPDEAFMVRELSPGALGSVSGIVRYHPCFDAAATST
jgi:putative acetyltransferase